MTWTVGALGHDWIISEHGRDFKYDSLSKTLLLQSSYLLEAKVSAHLNRPIGSLG